MRLLSWAKRKVGQMKINTAVVLLTVLCAWHSWSTTVSAEALKDKSNIVLIMADDFGYECVTCNVRLRQTTHFAGLNHRSECSPATITRRYAVQPGL